MWTGDGGFPDDAADSALIASGTVTLNSNIPDIANLQIGGGILTGTGNLGVSNLCTVTGGSMTGTGMLTCAASTISGVASKSIARPVTFSAGGSTTWTGGALALGSGGSIVNAGTFDIQGDLNLIGAGGSLTNTVTGTISKTVSAGTATIGAPLDNSGTVTILSGTADLTGGGTASGSFSVASAAKLRWSGGSYVLDSSSSVAGAGTTEVAGGNVQLDGYATTNMAILGGTLSGAGILDGSLTNSGGAVGPGDSPGELTIFGPFSQGAGGILRVEIDGPSLGQYDRLTVSGATTLNGTLDIVNAPAFTPALSDFFAFLRSSSRTGTFSTVNGAQLTDRSYTLAYLSNGADLLVQPASSTPSTPIVASTMPGPTGLRAAAVKKCKKSLKRNHNKKKFKKCKRRARRLPV
jgi:hypothetical protein